MRKKAAVLLLILLVLFCFPVRLHSWEVEHDSTAVSPEVSERPLSGSTHTAGYFSQYGKNPTDGTIAYRLSVGQITQDELDQVAGVIATESCDHVGKPAWILVDGKADNNWLPVLVFDCSGHEETTEWMKENNILAEIGFYLASELEIVGETGVTGQLALDCLGCGYEK